MTRGFTLIETVILIAITTIAFAGLVNLFITFYSVYGNQRAYSATSGSVATALNALGAAVLPADQVLTSTTLSGKTYTSATTTLVLELPSVDATGAIVSGAKDIVVFYASSTMLYRLVQANAASVRPSGLTTLSTTLAALTFTYDSTTFASVKNITADIQTSAQYRQQTLQGHLHEQWQMRNAP